MIFRILLADDNATDQFVVRKMLMQLGCEVDVVANGFLAVDAVRQRNYDLVLMDRHMPLLDGYEATRLIREYRPPYRLPIIAITASDDPDEFDQCVAAGMNDLLKKPVAQYKFRDMLCRWVAGYEKYRPPRGSRPETRQPL